MDVMQQIEPTCELGFLTVEMAKDLLENHNGTNRPPSEPRAKRIAQDISSGNWKLNGASIVIADDGEMLDGQTRCAAVILANIGVPTLFLRGVGRAVIDTIDDCRSRKFGDNLHISGIKNGNQVGAVIRQLIACRDQVVSIRSGASNQTMMKIFSDNEGVQDSANYAVRVFPKVSATLGAIHYAASILGEVEKAEQFIAVFSTGLPHYPQGKSDPAHKVRERLLRTNNTPSRLAPHVQHKLVLSAWASFRDGKEVNGVKPIDNYRIPGFKPQHFIVPSAA